MPWPAREAFHLTTLPSAFLVSSPTMIRLAGYLWAARCSRQWQDTGLVVVRPSGDEERQAGLAERAVGDADDVRLGDAGILGCDCVGDLMGVLAGSHQRGDSESPYRRASCEQELGWVRVRGTPRRLQVTSSAPPFRWRRHWLSSTATPSSPASSTVGLHPNCTCPAGCLTWPSTAIVIRRSDVGPASEPCCSRRKNHSERAASIGVERSAATRGLSRGSWAR